MVILNFIKKKILHSLSPKRHYCASTEFQKSIQVCILGADSPLGRSTSFLMKQNPLISVLRIQGDPNVHNLMKDLEFIDTRCKVRSFEGLMEASKAVRSADIVLMLGVANLQEDTSIADRILAEGPRIFELAKECTLYAPRALIVVAASPISVLTPLVAAAFKETHWYNPSRIVGSAALAQIKANTLLGRFQDLDPQICQVPIIGGPDIDIAVPLFSRAKPVELSDRAAQGLLARFRGVKEDEFPKKNCREDFVEDCTFSEAFALNHMITSIGKGLCGAKDAFYNAYVRSKASSTCQNLVTTLQFSRGGVVHNFGVPQLTRLELKLFEKAILQVKEREKMAEQFMEYLQNGGTDAPPFKVKETERKKLLQQTVLGM